MDIPQWEVRGAWETLGRFRGFADVRFSRSADSKLRDGRIYFGPIMTTELLPEEKLALLRETDSRRKWVSLDDQRVCVLCDRVITGRQIQVSRALNGSYSVHCPTPDCPAVPSDWFYQGTAFSSKASTLRVGEASIWTE